MQYVENVYIEKNKVLQSLNNVSDTFNKTITSSQKEFINSISAANISIGVGATGKGKTESAIFSCLSRLALGLTSKIFITSADINFLNKETLISSYRVIFNYFLGSKLTDDLLSQNIIQPVSITELATIDVTNGTILVEDGEYCTVNEVKSLIKNTRYSSRLILMGDLNNSFLKNNGLKNLIHNLYTKDLNVSNVDLQLILFDN